METTYEDLREDRRFDIKVRVRECSRVQRDKRAFELSVEDSNGTRFPFIVWEKSEKGRDYAWQEGDWYRLKDVTVNEWPSGKVLHGTSALEIENLGSRLGGKQTKILYMTDSHLGKRIHEYNGNSWSVSPESGFRAAMERAIEEEVSAVVHGGDIFHNPGDGIDEEDVAVCREELIRLADRGIPFYFIYGNHEREAGRRVMERFIDDGLAVHLGPRYELIGDTLAIYGIDHQKDWSEFVPDLEPSSGGTATMLCLHQAIEPFTKSSNPVGSITGLQRSANTPLDLIVTGHTHTRILKEDSGYTGLSGGATTRVGESRDDLSPTAEMISVQDSGVTVEQEYL